MGTDRFARQCILPEIKEEGQKRLLQACFRADPALSPWAQTMARRYALAAGFGDTKDAASEPSVPRSASFFRHTASAEVGLAAFSVLAQSLPLFDLPSPNA